MPYVGKAMDRKRNRRIGEALAKETTLRAESMQCHTCDRLGGLDCLTSDGKPTRPHKARERLALVITRDVTLGRLAPRSGVVEHDQPCPCSHCTGDRIAEFDRRTWTRVFIGGRMSREVAMRAWREGQKARAAGVPCSCAECGAGDVAG